MKVNLKKDKNFIILTIKEIKALLDIAEREKDNVVIYDVVTPVSDEYYVIPQKDWWEKNQDKLENITDYESW